MTDHKIGTREEWQAQRDALLQREKELTHRNDELAAQRRELPWVPVEKEYTFEAEDGGRPIIYYPRSAYCSYPYVQNLTIMVNSNYNGWRFEDVWLDR